MTKPADYYTDDDGNLHPATLGVLTRALDRLHDLYAPYTDDGDDDIAQAVARIPDDAQRQEASELLERRIRSIIGPHLNAINAIFDGN